MAMAMSSVKDFCAFHTDPLTSENTNVLEILGDSGASCVSLTERFHADNEQRCINRAALHLTVFLLQIYEGFYERVIAILFNTPSVLF